MHHLRSPFLALAIISLFFLVAEGKNMLNNKEAGTDFSIYYQAAGQFEMNPDGLYATQAAGFDQYLYPPPSIAIFRLYHLFPVKTAYLLFIITMYGCLLLALRCWLSLSRKNTTPGREQPFMPVSPGASRYRDAGILLFALASAPVYHNISLGQINCLVLALSILYIFSYTRTPFLAGMLLAIAIWIKIYPVFLLLPALFSREGRKTILYCCLWGFLIPLILLPWIPAGLYLDFLHKLASTSQYTCANIINQSLVAFGMRTRVGLPQFFGWPNIFLIPGWLKLLNYAALATVLLTVILVSIRSGSRKVTSQQWSMPALLAASALFSPLGWGHAFVFSLPLLILGMDKIERCISPKSLSYAILLFTGLLFLIPVYSHPALMDHLPALLQNIYYSRLGWISLLLIFWLIPSRWHKKGPSTIIPAP